jgi:hypothetical protein
VEGHKAHHVALQGRRLPVVGRWHPPFWLGPAHPWPQKTVVDQLLQPPLYHRGTSPRVHRKDLALICHGCRKTACGDDRRRSNDSVGRWLKGAKVAKEAKEAKKAKTQKGL